MVQGAIDVRIANGVMFSCGFLPEWFTVPPGVVGLLDGCMSGQPMLCEVRLPYTLRDVGHCVFANCPRLRRIYVPGALYRSVPWIAENTEAVVLCTGDELTEEDFDALARARVDICSDFLIRVGDGSFYDGWCFRSHHDGCYIDYREFKDYYDMVQTMKFLRETVPEPTNAVVEVEDPYPDGGTFKDYVNLRYMDGVAVRGAEYRFGGVRIDSDKVLNLRTCLSRMAAGVGGMMSWGDVDAFFGPEDKRRWAGYPVVRARHVSLNGASFGVELYDGCVVCDVDQRGVWMRDGTCIPHLLAAKMGSLLDMDIPQMDVLEQYITGRRMKMKMTGATEQTFGSALEKPMTGQEASLVMLRDKGLRKLYCFTEYGSMCRMDGLLEPANVWLTRIKRHGSSWFSPDSMLVEQAPMNQFSGYSLDGLMDMVGICRDEGILCGNILPLCVKSLSMYEMGKLSCTVVCLYSGHSDGWTDTTGLGVAVLPLAMSGALVEEYDDCYVARLAFENVAFDSRVYARLHAETKEITAGRFVSAVRKEMSVVVKENCWRS